MVTLLAKDFKLLFGKEKSLTKRIISILVSICFIACFIAIEVFLFTTILKKIGKFHQAPIAFMNLFLFIISLLIIISGIFRANKLFFDEKDIEQLSIRPVSNSSIILSKLIFLFITHCGMTLMFVYPLFIAYGSVYPAPLTFYYLALFYPLVSFFFEMGVSLLFVYPFWLLKKYLNKHLIIKFVVNLIVLFIGCYLYAKVLNIFIEIVAGNNIVTLFTEESISKLISFRRYEVPANFLTDIFIQKNYSSFIPYTLLGLGIFILGLSITIFAFGYVRNISVASSVNKKEKRFKQTSIKKALIKKEISLLTKNSSYTMSFTGLLIVQPFLTYLVIMALNTIFRSGVFAYYISVVPNFIPLIDIVILMLFTVIINQGASEYIQAEKKTIKLLKTIPVNYKTQLLIKVSIPFVLSFVSLVITLLVLLLTKTIVFTTFIFALILVTVLLIIFDLISLKEELSIRNHKPRTTFMSNLYSYVLPIIYFVVCTVLSYFGVSFYIAYIVSLLVFISFGIPYVVYLKKNMESLFMDLDVVN